MMKRTHLPTALVALLLGLVLTACGQSDAQKSPDSQQTAPVITSAPSETPEPTPPAPADPFDAVKTYWSEDQLTQAWGPDQVVEHLFFHPVIAYPQFAFFESNLPKSQRLGLDDWMLTVDEYVAILDSLYEKDYILVPMESVWSETTNADGKPEMVRNTLMLPEGKKPLIISFDDVNYYPYMLEGGFTSKLVLNDEGEIRAECTDPYTGETTLTQDLDATTILDQFILDRPDFSLNGAKGVFSLTGYMGILGYRTQNDIDIALDSPDRPAFDAYRAGEIEAVKPIIQRLRETGWTFCSHTWGHINLANKSYETMVRDAVRWQEEVGTLIGPTNILIYPHGARPDGGDDLTQTGPMLQYLYDAGFRVFASVGVESYSKIRTDIPIVLCDRLHPDGTTLRNQRSRYLRFFDAAEVMDMANRPDLPYHFDQ